MTAILTNSPTLKSSHPHRRSLGEVHQRKNSVDDSLEIRRVYPDAHPGTRSHLQPGLWAARWIGPQGNLLDPGVVAYRLEFELPEARAIRIHLTGDERYEFIADEKSIGIGPEGGDEEHWFFETYDLKLPAGRHVWVARVWSLFEKALHGQRSLRHGFLLSPDDPDLVPLLATGHAAWQCQVLPGFGWRPPLACAWATGWSQIVDGRLYAWGHELGNGRDWEDTTAGAFGDSGDAVRMIALQKVWPHHRLLPAALPPMAAQPCEGAMVRHVAEFSHRPVGLQPVREVDCLPREVITWQNLIDGVSLIQIPAHTRRRVVIDLGNYYCARPRITVSGGTDASVEVDWSEALYEDIKVPPGTVEIEGMVWPKGNRDEIEGKYFVCPWFREDGPGDTFLLDGGKGRVFTTLWWKAGRYVQILVETQDEPLRIEAVEFLETRYPLEMEGSFRCSDESLNSLIPLLLRGLQMCAHETYMDCPYYEQLMYVGDTRLQVLATYVLTSDDRLPRKALQLFDWSRLSSGLTQSRYPARVRQIIPPFSLWWVAMCHDFAMWRGDQDFLRTLLPGIRAVCDYFGSLIREDGLLGVADGWNFTDWVPGWNAGVAPTGEGEPSAVLCWQAALVFRLAGELERWCGEPEIGALQERRSQTIAQATHEAFWNQERGLYADDLAHKHWSEHAQCLAILSEKVPPPCLDAVRQGLLTCPDLKRASIYFSHYLFEAYQRLGCASEISQRLGLWHSLRDAGLKTPIESPEPSRSDCHAWGSHPLYHYYATLAGIRPAAFGFDQVAIAPQLGGITECDAVLPHPRGEIRVSVRDGQLMTELPAGVALVN